VKGRSEIATLVVIALVLSARVRMAKRGATNTAKRNFMRVKRPRYRSPTGWKNLWELKKFSSPQSRLLLGTCQPLQPNRSALPCHRRA
jgi:hypothetical protein